MELISKELNNRLDAIVTGAFFLNRILDRMMSLLSVKFKMLKSSKLLHEKLAHHFPIAADSVSNFQDSRGMLTIYGETPRADFDATTHIELFEMMLEEFIKYQDLIEDVIDFASQEKDLMTKNFLMKYLSELNPYISTAMNLIDIATAYGTDGRGMQLFDVDIEKCLAVPNLAEGD